jgi:protein-tyrosine phosphatase
MSLPNGAGPARILCVCTANVCRSPMTELLLSAGLAARVPELADSVVVTSAGARAQEGQPIAAHAVDLLAERGIDAAGFRSRELSPELVETADLVLCASRTHKAAVIALDPTAREITFTVREFAWLLQQQPVPAGEPDLPQRLEQLVAVARDRRGLEHPDRPEDFDLDDPFGQRKSAFRKTLALLDETLAGPLDLLAQQSASPQGGVAVGSAASPPPEGARRRWLWR